MVIVVGQRGIDLAQCELPSPRDLLGAHSLKGRPGSDIVNGDSVTGNMRLTSKDIGFNDDVTGIDNLPRHPR